MKKTSLTLLVLAILVSCHSKNTDGITGTEIDTNTIRKIDQLPNPDPKADLSQTNDFANAFNDYQEQFEFTSSIITSRRWVVKNDINGKPISRERIAAIISELDGKCYIQHFIFKQNSDGTNFESSYISEAYGWKEFDCKLLN